MEDVKPQGRAQSADSPDDLLYVDSTGRPTSVEDLISDGLDGAYRHRIPGFITLSRTGKPLDRLLAVEVLLAWGVPEGFHQLLAWARDPAATPWAEEPVMTDRITGVDASFEALASGVRSSFWNVKTEDLRLVQLQALRALLGASLTHYVGNELALACVRDPRLNLLLEPDLVRAVEGSLSKLQRGDKELLDRPLQTASLIMPLAKVNDDAAASAAERLIATQRADTRALRELAEALAAGLDSGTLEIIKRLLAGASESVRPSLERAHAYRTRAES